MGIHNNIPRSFVGQTSVNCKQTWSHQHCTMPAPHLWRWSRRQRPHWQSPSPWWGSGEQTYPEIITMSGAHLLGRNVKWDSSQVYTLEMVNAGNHKEYSRTLLQRALILSSEWGLLLLIYLCSSLLQSTKPKYNCSFVLLNDLLKMFNVEYLGGTYSTKLDRYF